MIDVEKYHGTGNDFLIVDGETRMGDRRGFARRVCDRRTGIEHADSDRRGADGVLFLALEPSYNPPRVVMTLVQPDGSVAAMCGNGARCAALWAAERTGRDEVMIDTPAGTRRAAVDGDRAAVDMGPPAFEPSRVPVQADGPLVETDVEGLTVTAVNTGVPHAVAFVEDVERVPLDELAPPVREAAVFPRGANVTIAAPRASGDGFDQRTYERGVEGETRACGTGAVAIAAVAERLGRIGVDERITVEPPGGELQITIGAASATLEGPARFEYADTVPAVGGVADD